ncbi:replicative DNA helicase [Candidatus Gottesmanbacteria bacterium RIFCSPLOWO2_01_FULL_48_11]|uniref:Replicative DNA helicase n=2 Tax=Candidatus Gottesmaniibacteriota TaxID=1752720 RepID=A0A0G1TWK2_9BACT|nr:MAG: Replicative DNA helicase [Candidatus Gottesmanbacteria bacterium GW2011_GWA2_47_9]OGG28367.1 MAG: replicative DNA helicase [Candidatus Gottesmanbacteria bacterium RIFCSPLOWO2_01_FULL_48_11]
MDPKVPPHDEVAEQSVLGAILIDKDAMVDVAEFLRPEQFYKDSHAFIFAAMVGLYESHEPIDVVTVTAQLKKDGNLKNAGGASYVSELLNVVPTSAHAERYGRIIQENFTKRQLVEAAAKITEFAFREEGSAQEIVNRAEQEIFAISQQSMRRDFIPIKDALAASFDRLDELHKRAGGLRGVPTGFIDMDNKLAGMQDANLIILAARPGTGKTAMVLNIAQHVAVKEKIPVGIFSLEMSKEELVDRLLVSQADIDAWRLKTGKLSDDDFTRLSEAMGELAEAPLFIDDTPGISIIEMRTKARRLQVEQGVKLIIVDYLQLADSGRHYDNRVQEVSIISQNLKNIARELRVPVLACSQLSRAVEARGTRVPELSDLRESGSIEQDADVVMFLYREEGDQSTWGEQIATKLRVAKHRNGPLAEIDLMFRGDRIRFYSVERKRGETAS